MQKIFCLMIAGTILIGCSDIHLPTYTSPTASLLPPNELCERAKDRWALGIDSGIQAEVYDRGLAKYGDWERIRASKIRKGMSDCAAVAILGLPGKVALEPYVVGKKENRLWFYGKGKNRSLLYVLDIKWGQVEVCRRPIIGSDSKYTSC